MRFNQETVRLAPRQSVASKEGRLRHKAPKENSYKDRGVRLRANLLFYFKLDDTKTRIEREPSGWILLEDISVKVETYADEPYVFSIVCGNDKHFFSAPSELSCNDWVAAIQEASYTHLHTQIRSLCRVIQQRTRRDPMADIVERIAQRRNSEQPAPVRKPNQVITPAVSLAPLTSLASQPSQAPRQPTRKAPPPPPAAQQKSTWFTDLQTLEPQAFVQPSASQHPPQALLPRQPLDVNRVQGFGQPQAITQHTSQHQSQHPQHSSQQKAPPTLHAQGMNRVYAQSMIVQHQAPVVKRPQVNSSNTRWHVQSPTSPRPLSLPGGGAGAGPGAGAGSQWFADLDPMTTAQAPTLDPFGMDTAFHQQQAADLVDPFQTSPPTQGNTDKPLKFNWTTFE